jgi:hypothetical protein
MKISSRELRSIIREELMREMPVGIPRMMGSARDRLMRRKSPPRRRPPNLVPAEPSGVSCGTCAAFCPKTLTCKAFGGYPVSADMVCDAWTPKS